MSQEANIEIAELVIPGLGRAEGSRVAEAVHRELSRLWQEDQRAGLPWRREIADATIELDDGLSGERLGEAIARQIRIRARVGSEGR